MSSSHTIHRMQNNYTHVYPRSGRRLLSWRHSATNPTGRSFKTAHSGAYYADVPAESLKRYQPGGYHPIRIGDSFRHDRYRIDHKLGWGGYSTVWLATDTREDRLVALKILSADQERDSHETVILDRLGREDPSASPLRPSPRYLLDYFTLHGPNGSHSCLVTPVGGTSVQMLCSRFHSERLPGWMAWELSRQLVEAVAHMHSVGIVHGDLYPGNILVTTEHEALQQANILNELPLLSRGDVHALPGHRLTPHLPPYLVEPVDFPLDTSGRSLHARIIDFGQLFLVGTTPKRIRTPLVFRAPELLLDHLWDHRIDMWALACTIFQLATGQTPFDNLMPNEDALVREWIATFGPLPSPWRPTRDIPRVESIEEMPLREWLRECYYGVERKPEFAEQHIEWLGEMLKEMMQYEPQRRTEARYVLNAKWFERTWLL
ncbi:hypothetical protein CAC42_2059 [Sphaceloma murrayae]|uniref:non-specific serine/threonine protein kinase n=1 Tax=Sphaceloma murrayae TaxID=2082308 RepID=A0A2K1QIV8_9PEZI|nr:hypothetical protein CAC42_2059 [Sphaceloma murrayae]